MAIPNKIIQSLKEARQRLAKANGLDRVKRIWCQAEVFRLEASIMAADRSLALKAIELRLLAEQKLGKLIAAMKLRGGDRKSAEFDRRR